MIASELQGGFSANLNEGVIVYQEVKTSYLPN